MRAVDAGTQIHSELTKIFREIRRFYLKYGEFGAKTHITSQQQLEDLRHIPA